MDSYGFSVVLYGFFVDWHGEENIGHGMAWHDFALYKCTSLHGLLINLNFQCRFKYKFQLVIFSFVIYFYQM